MPPRSPSRRAAARLKRSLPYRLLNPVVDLRRLAAAPPGYARFLRDLRRYRRMPGAEPVRLREIAPQVVDAIPVSPFDKHYFHQDSWAARRIAKAAPARHVDVGSRVDLVGFLTAVTDVVFVDIRPLDVDIPRLTPMAGSIVDLPFESRTLESVSCLHVAEHIGLGRYGDPLDPNGTRRAAAELQRVVAPGGELLFSLPVGAPRLVFNAHRIHDPREVPGMFGELELVEFSGVDDAGRWAEGIEPAELAGSDYACGCYRFRRA